MKLTNENVFKIVEKLRSKYQKQRTIPTWLSHSNCMSLLNLPDMIEEFGPLRNLWELRRRISKVNKANIEQNNTKLENKST